MAFTDDLKDQLIAFVDIYKKRYRQTLGITISFTIVSFVISAFLLLYSVADKNIETSRISLLSGFSHRYSSLHTYCIIDLEKSVFLFFISFFSLGLARLSKEDDLKKELSFKDIFTQITSKDLAILIIVFLVTTIADYILNLVPLFLTHNLVAQQYGIYNYVWGLLFHLRIYIPLVVFSYAIRSLLAKGELKISLASFLLLYASLWLFNEFAFEFLTWADYYLLRLILLPFSNSESYAVIESILSIPLFAFLFLGYSSAMSGQSSSYSTLTDNEHLQ